jgi:hypothetical protein
MGQGIEAQLGLVWIVVLTPIQLNTCELGSILHQTSLRACLVILVVIEMVWNGF